MNSIKQMVGNIDGSYSDDISFLFGYYDELYESLLDTKSSGNLDEERLYNINRFIEWYSEYGKDVLISTIHSLDGTMAEQIHGFVDLYVFLLNSVRSDIDKLIDQMYYVIGRFAKDFMKNTQTYVKRCYSDEEFLKHDTYRVKNLGNLSSGSHYFIRRFSYVNQRCC